MRGRPIRRAGRSCNSGSHTTQSPSPTSSESAMRHPSVRHPPPPRDRRSGWSGHHRVRTRRGGAGSRVHTSQLCSMRRPSTPGPPQRRRRLSGGWPPPVLDGLTASPPSGGRTPPRRMLRPARSLTTVHRAGRVVAVGMSPLDAIGQPVGGLARLAGAAPDPGSGGPAATATTPPRTAQTPPGRGLCDSLVVER